MRIYRSCTTAMCTVCEFQHYRMSTSKNRIRQLIIFVLMFTTIVGILIITLWNPLAVRLGIKRRRQSTRTVMISIPAIVSQLYDTQRYRDPILFNKIQATVSSLSSHTEADLFPRVLDLTNNAWHQNTAHRTIYRKTLRSAINMSTFDHLLYTEDNLHVGDMITSIDGVKLKTTASLMGKFEQPKISPFRTVPSYKRCSVVGNSDLLSGSQCGSEIDSADVVFRFNLAPTSGFERDVGTKTTITTMNQSIIRKQYGRLKTRKQVQNFANVLSKQPDALIWTPVFAISGNHQFTFDAIKKTKAVNSKLRFGIQDPRHFIAIRDFWSSHGLKAILSTGFYFVNTAIDLCDRVDLFGFWPFNKTVDGKPLSYHYYNDSPFYVVHEMDYEMKLLVAMHSHGLLQLHVRNCTNGPLS